MCIRDRPRAGWLPIRLKTKRPDAPPYRGRTSLRTRASCNRRQSMFQFRLFRQFAGTYQFFFLVFDLLNVYQKSGDDRILFIMLQHAVSEFPPLVTGVVEFATVLGLSLIHIFWPPALRATRHTRGSTAPWNWCGRRATCLFPCICATHPPS